MGDFVNNNKIYLGDGLYGEFDGYQFRLYTSNGFSEDNEVFLEPTVLNTFWRWVKSFEQKEESQ